jgi:LAO/AO transport system kinase
VADTTLVVEAPDMGDEVQAIKAGLLEVADIVVVTKGDRPEAARTAARLRAMLAIGREPVARSRSGPPTGRQEERPWPTSPVVHLTSATTGAGIAELLAALDARAPARDPAGGPETELDGGARLARARAQLEGIVAERLRTRILDAIRSAETEALLRGIASHEIDPYEAADRVIAALDRPPV